MLDRCRAMLAMSLESLIHLDAELGQGIKHKDDLVDMDYETLYESLVRSPLRAGETVESIVLLVLVIRYLERMADHATNIGNRVVYIVTGKRG